VKHILRERIWTFRPSRIHHTRRQILPHRLSKSQHTSGQNCKENQKGSRDRPSWLIMAISHHSSHISASPSPLSAPPLNVQYLQSTISSYLPDICTNQGLTPNAENTENLSIICHMHGGRSKSPHRLNKTQLANTLLAKIVKRNEMSSHDQHIIMLPFLAHGHLIPFLALARQLHQTTGFTITIVSTPSTFNTSNPSFPPTRPTSTLPSSLSAAPTTVYRRMLRILRTCLFITCQSFAMHR
jgi:hypothetical protein